MSETRQRQDVFGISLQKALDIFGLDELKPDQKESIRRIVVERQDVLAILPTGYGKSIIYQILPKLHEEIHLTSHGEKKHFTVIIVSPLQYIRTQQIQRLEKIGIKATSLGESAEVDKEIAKGSFEIIFGSAEQWLSLEWRKLLQQGKIGNVQTLVVDEVHTVETWGVGKKGQAAFREAFGRVAELRSFLPSGTPVLGLTATANKEMRGRLMKFLGMPKKCMPIVVSPNRKNIRFSVLKADPTFSCFNWLVDLLLEEKENAPFTIIFCQVVNDIVTVLSHLLVKLGSSGIYVTGDSPAHLRCLIGVYYSQSPQSHKDSITQSFEGNGNVRVVIASSALSMGVDFSHVSHVIHFGPSKSLSGHLQEAGRAGRDGSNAYNITVYLGKHLIHCDKQVKTAIKSGLTSCARIALLKDYDESVTPLQPLHDCCSFCHQQCKCGDDGVHCKVTLHCFDKLPAPVVEPVEKNRVVTNDEKQCLTSALQDLQLSLSCHSKLSVLDASGHLIHGLSNIYIKTIVKNADKIHSISDLTLYCPIASFKLRLMILEVLNEIFEDIIITDDMYRIAAIVNNLADDITETVSLEHSLPDDIPSDYSSDELSE